MHKVFSQVSKAISISSFLLVSALQCETPRLIYIRESPSLSKHSALAAFAQGASTGPEQCTNFEELAEAQLKVVFSRLGSFLKGAKFDYKEFEASAPKLQTQLTNIQHDLYDAAPLSKALSRQLDFTESIFRTMLDASECLTYYNCTANFASELLCKITHLNVALVSMFDFCGIPYTRSPTFSADLARSQRFLRIWSDIYSVLKDVPLSVRTMFSLQLEQATSTLVFLSKYRP